jgi:HK97 family phage portal protein
MKLSQRVKAAYKTFTSKSLYNSIGSVFRNIFGETEYNPQSQMRGITYKAVDKIGQSVSKYEIQVKTSDGKVMQNNKLIELSKHPNSKYRTSSYFHHLWAMYDIVYGESFWYMAKGETTKQAKEIYLLNPSQVELKIGGGELLGYVLHKSDGSQVPLEIDEVVHDKRPNIFNEWRGMSILERAAEYVQTEITTTRFTLNYMRNNASPSGIVSLPDSMDKEAFK